MPATSTTAALAVLAVAVALAPWTRADTPVHCLYNTTVGTWTFHTTATTPGTAGSTTNCSTVTSFPNSLQVTLSPPNVATATDPTTGAPLTGTFTLVYDEGFAVDLPAAPGGMGPTKWWSFFKFVQDGTKVQSMCGETFPSNFHDAPTAPGVQPANWGCYYATKATASPEEAASLVTTHELLFAGDSAGAKALDTAVVSRDEGIVHKVAASGASWTATAEPPASMLGRKLTSLFPDVRTAARVGSRVPNPAPKHLAAANTVPTPAALPAAFTWKNASGVDYLGPIRDQLECGSCYAFGSTNMLNSRLIIQKARSSGKKPDNDPFIFAPQDIVSCSQYSHGCNGGFPYLVAKYAEDYSIVDEQCFGYTAGILPTASCSDKCKATDSQRYFVDPSYNYVGGFYGACTESLMQQDIMANGPLAVSMQVYADLLAYKSGVYSHTTATPAYVPQAPEPTPFQLTNHIVLIVGWGTSPSGEPYWVR